MGAASPHAPENAEMTISFGLSGLMSIDVSPSCSTSVFLRFGSVLLTTASTRKILGSVARSGRVPCMPTPVGDCPRGAISSRDRGRLYLVLSGGELLWG